MYTRYSDRRAFGTGVLPCSLAFSFYSFGRNASVRTALIIFRIFPVLLRDLSASYYAYEIYYVPIGSGSQSNGVCVNVTVIKS
jgi:hypothetical protein